MSEVDQFANVEILVPKLVTTATSLERWDFKRMSGRSNISTNRSTNPERLVMISLISVSYTHLTLPTILRV